MSFAEPDTTEAVSSRGDAPAPNMVWIACAAFRLGSHLCAPSLCRCYRAAAHHSQPVDTSTSHVGFRCVVRQRSTS